MIYFLFFYTIIIINEKFSLGGEKNWYPGFAEMMTILSYNITLFETFRDDGRRLDMLHCYDRSAGTYSVTNLRGERGSLASFWQSNIINYGGTGKDYISEEELEEKIDLIHLNKEKNLKKFI